MVTSRARPQAVFHARNTAPARSQLVKLRMAACVCPALAHEAPFTPGTLPIIIFCMNACLPTMLGSFLPLGAKTVLAQPAVDPAPASGDPYGWFAVVVALILVLALCVASFISSKRTHHD
jgi:hypothetical protein